MINLPQEGFWQPKLLDAGASHLAACALAAGSPVSIQAAPRAGQELWGKWGWCKVVVQPVPSLQLQLETQLTREGTGGTLWTPPWQQMTCGPHPLGQHSAFLPPLTAAAPLLILPCCGKVQFCSWFFLLETGISISSQKRILFHSTPFPLILCFCYQTLQAFGVVTFLKPASYAGQFRRECMWQWPGTLWLPLPLLLACR